ncbi:MAG: hypothetical protein K5872_20665 [Rhizobiaceae bacterium]|nr:hypothetical protein [Rhizobiaceae bacterium]MCV0408633.1 hypothetical protein [Rhizobiaceae bacterium]
MDVDRTDGRTVATGLVDQRFMVRVFLVFAAMAVFAAGLNVASMWIGRSIAMAGHSDDTTGREIVIGNDVFAIPANTIRDPEARTDGVYSRIDLYLAWPSLEGYTSTLRDVFNHSAGQPRVVFLTLERQTMSRDMSGRLEPIYRALVTPRGMPGPDGIMLHEFPAGSGFSEEVLAIGRDKGGSAFVARCLTGEAGATSLAPCQRDVAIGGGLVAAYRFPMELLGEWRNLDQALLGWIASKRQTDAES